MNRVDPATAQRLVDCVKILRQNNFAYCMVGNFRQLTYELVESNEFDEDIDDIKQIDKPKLNDLRKLWKKFTFDTTHDIFSDVSHSSFFDYPGDLVVLSKRTGALGTDIFPASTGTQSRSAVLAARREQDVADIHNNEEVVNDLVYLSEAKANAEQTYIMEVSVMDFPDEDDNRKLEEYQRARGALSSRNKRQLEISMINSPAYEKGSASKLSRTEQNTDCSVEPEWAKKLNLSIKNMHEDVKAHRDEKKLFEDRIKTQEKTTAKLVKDFKAAAEAKTAKESKLDKILADFDTMKNRMNTLEASARNAGTLALPEPEHRDKEFYYNLRDECIRTRRRYIEALKAAREKGEIIIIFRNDKFYRHEDHGFSFDLPAISQLLNANFVVIQSWKQAVNSRGITTVACTIQLNGNSARQRHFTLTEILGRRAEPGLRENFIMQLKMPAKYEYAHKFLRLKNALKSIVQFGTSVFGYYYFVLEGSDERIFTGCPIKFFSLSDEYLTKENLQRFRNRNKIAIVNSQIIDLPETWHFKDVQKKDSTIRQGGQPPKRASSPNQQQISNSQQSQGASSSKSTQGVSENRAQSPETQNEAKENVDPEVSNGEASAPTATAQETQSHGNPSKQLSANPAGPMRTKSNTWSNGEERRGYQGDRRGYGNRGVERSSSSFFNPSSQNNYRRDQQPGYGGGNYNRHQPGYGGGNYNPPQYGYKGGFGTPYNNNRMQPYNRNNNQQQTYPTREEWGQGPSGANHGSDWFEDGFEDLPNIY